jgi:hypothetical protein
VFIEERLDLLGAHIFDAPRLSGLALTVFLDDLATKGDTLITDVDFGSGDEFLDVSRLLATEGATDFTVWIQRFHGVLPNGGSLHIIKQTGPKIPDFLFPLEFFLRLNRKPGEGIGSQTTFWKWFASDFTHSILANLYSMQGFIDLVDLFTFTLSDNHVLSGFLLKHCGIERIVHTCIAISDFDNFFVYPKLSLREFSTPGFKDLLDLG